MRTALLAVVFLSPFVAAAAPARPDLGAAYEAEYARLLREMSVARTNVRGQQRVARQALRQSALILRTDRDPLDVVLRRTEAMLNHLRAMPDGADLAAESGELARLRSAAAKLPPAGPQRQKLFNTLCLLRRKIAFRNPLLDFDEIIFLVRNPPAVHHMVPQYFGSMATPGGGVRVLKDPFGESPRVYDPLAAAAVSNGRLKGKTLDRGSCVGLDLSYDARTILFAWTQAGRPAAGASHEGQPWRGGEASARKASIWDSLYWSPETTYHILKADIATGKKPRLTQLTDGKWNDFDPCFLPGGRIAFVSERRGGMGRCHTLPFPSYTLHAMMPDGSDIIALSHHETNEWNPSVDHNGMIAYTRWDYVDRSDCIAHHIWLCYPDGRDSRSYHGNYPLRPEHRPQMELAVRAVPGSGRFVAVAGPHHGQAYGPLILIDQDIEDDNAMSQIRRITPQTAFAELESAPGTPGQGARKDGLGYGTPWPLDEDFYICVYDAPGSRYGLYLVDSFGNQEPLYLDPELTCLDPIPLRPRRRPPVLPVRTRQARADRIGANPKASVVILNVYASDFDWPKGTKIDAIRVVQLYPKTTYHKGRPMIGAARESLARGVLGTAPVERDGSAHFEVPAGVPIYFQALNAAGLAVQSMRSATYVHRGERLVCAGCHEPKLTAPAARSGGPALALRRGPDKLAPDAEGSRPLLYPRLVQPVLDRHCAKCHAKKRAAGNRKPPDLSGTTFGANGWSQSFIALAPLGYAMSGQRGMVYRQGPRSRAGRVGAMASPLYQMLRKGHNRVKLPPADLHRITLWLDCNTNFYGAYHDLQTQAGGQTVMPDLE